MMVRPLFCQKTKKRGETEELEMNPKIIVVFMPKPPPKDHCGFHAQGDMRFVECLLPRNTKHGQ
jgi:hypothetical protein